MITPRRATGSVVVDAFNLIQAQQIKEKQGDAKVDAENSFVISS